MKRSARRERRSWLQISGKAGSSSHIHQSLARDGRNVFHDADAPFGMSAVMRSYVAGLLEHARETTIFLARTHVDHIQGIPFFVPAFLPGNKVVVYGGGLSSGRMNLSLQQILEGQMREVYSPIVSLSNMPSISSIHDVTTDVTTGGKIEVGGAVVRPLVIPNGREAPTVAYRIDEDGRSLVYVTDVEYPKDGPGAAVVELARGADVLIHEAFETDEERRRATGPRPEGHVHATFGEATELAIRAGAKRLFFTHHHPDRDDRSVARAVDAERARAASRAHVEIDTAREGVELGV